jgi:hypothetical protein
VRERRYGAITFIEGHLLHGAGKNVVAAFTPSLHHRDMVHQSSKHQIDASDSDTGGLNSINLPKNC